MSLRIAVLTIGDELLNGELGDTNTAAIARTLAEAGFDLRESRCVGDVEADIQAALEGLVERFDAVIVTGGLGPTADDLTARAAARAFGRHLVLNEEALQQIREHFRETGRDMPAGNEKQALLPQQVRVLPNLRGTAPGFLLHHRGKHLFFLPGVPTEMIAMLGDAVLPHLQDLNQGDFPPCARVVKVFGIAEPKVEELLGTAALPAEVSVAFGVDFPLVHVKLRARGEDAEALVDRAEGQVRRALGDYVVAAGRQSLAGEVARMLENSGLTLSLAESCTGGLVAKLLTDIPGASNFLERGAVTYADSAKRDWLGVPAEILEREGAVSEACALAMARGLRQAAGTDLTIAITGIAGPGGGTPQKPVGTVCLALSAADTDKVHAYRFAGERKQVRIMAAFMALEWLRRYLMAAQAAAADR